MGGWTWYYGLLNFAILAAVLYVFGKKIVAKMFREHREKIANGLKKGQEAGAAVAELSASSEKDAAAAAAELDSVLSQTRARIEDSRRSSAEAEKQLTAEVRSRLEQTRLRLSRESRRRLGSAAAAEIGEQARVLLAQAEPARRRELSSAFIQELSSLVSVTPYDAECARCGAGIPVCVTSPAPLDQDLRRELISVISEKYTGIQLSFTFSEDASLLGGVRVRIGDTVYDGSLLSKLGQAQSAIAGSTGGHTAADGVEAAISTLSVETERFQTGKVERLLDGICHISGLGDVMTGETVEFPGGLRGMVMNLSAGDVGVVMLGDYSGVQEGVEVRRTGRIIEVPVGEALIGRVVDALGRPIDGKGELNTTLKRPIESPAPSVIDRQSVSVPLQTGIKAVDALIPIGRGQRELIIGDRQTGKTSIALDTIINQKDKGVICIYVAIGQKESTVARVVEKLRENGALSYSTVVCANASDPAALLYIAPYAGCAMGEYFMYSGKDVLIIYDDLSKQAVAYREISLLLQRPPGREAYPGDIFYLHSRLLERAARLNAASGGGSMTALPIVETQAGNISAYIPTNVISITDGQIFLEADLFNAGVRPAINVGLSVSRVGGSAQLGAMKQVAASLRLKLAQYRELEAFSQFGSEMDKATRDALHRGDRLTQLLKQPLFTPMDAADQIVSIFAVNEGYADGVDTEDIGRYESGLIEFAASRWPELKRGIMGGKKLTDEQLQRLRGIIEEYGRSF